VRLGKHLESLTLLAANQYPAMRSSYSDRLDGIRPSVVFLKRLKHLRLPFGVSNSTLRSFEALLLGLPSLETLSLAGIDLRNQPAGMLRSCTLKRLVVRGSIKIQDIDDDIGHFIECTGLQSISVGDYIRCFGAMAAMFGDGSDELVSVRRLLPSGWRIAIDTSGRATVQPLSARPSDLMLKVSPAPNDGIRLISD